MFRELLSVDGIDESQMYPAGRGAASSFRPERAESPALIRSQAMEIIDSVLGPNRASGSEVAARLRAHLSAHPKQPERALLEHLMETARINRAGTKHY